MPSRFCWKFSSSLHRPSVSLAVLRVCRCGCNRGAGPPLQPSQRSPAAARGARYLVSSGCEGRGPHWWHLQTCIPAPGYVSPQTSCKASAPPRSVQHSPGLPGREGLLGSTPAHSACRTCVPLGRLSPGAPPRAAGCLAPEALGHREDRPERFLVCVSHPRFFVSFI